MDPREELPAKGLPGQMNQLTYTKASQSSSFTPSSSVSTLSCSFLESRQSPAAWPSLSPSLPCMSSKSTTAASAHATATVPVSSSSVSKETVANPASAAMKPQPARSGGSSSTAAGTAAVPAHTPVGSRSSLLRFPVRIGITWKKGERLEAQDFSNTWYPSKIVEISEEEKAVLIHFEGWNSRYDEWVDMASERLRPTTRHSERKDKGLNKRRRVHPHPIYRPGDEVLARWKDCKKYPAKINRLIEESTYEVVFYDGVTHLIQAMNIQPMSAEMKASMTKSTPPAPKAKISFKQVKLNLPVSLRKKQEQKQERSRQSFSGKVLAKSKRSPSKLLGKSKLVPKVTLRRDRELDVFSVTANKGPSTPVKKVHKEPSPVTITCEATLSTLSEAECLKLFGSAVLGGGDTSEVNNEEPSTSGGGFSTVATEPTKGIDSEGTVHAGYQKFAPLAGKESKGGKKLSSQRVRKRAYTDTSTGGKRRKLASVGSESDATKDVKTLKKPQLQAVGSGERSKSLDIPEYLGTPPPLAPLIPQIFIPSKAFIVEEDHNPFKCPHEGCTKDFRKENLLQYHIKYYHTEPEALTSSSPNTASRPSPTVSTAVNLSTNAVSASVATATSAASIGGNTGRQSSDLVNSTAVQASAALTPNTCHPKKRRRKTDSICSTDSEMSASSKSKSSKRHRNDSEISVTTASPEVAGREPQTDSSRLVQELTAEEEILAWPDTEEADEEEMASDVVNCVCGQRHHSGLMIQCEVCMCWQHFKCADVKKTGVPPANYVCLICENSSGKRDSCKYLHDMGWERRGELPTFPFVQQNTSDSNPRHRSSTTHLTGLASECNDLLATLQGIKRALHSTRRQIKISKEEDDPEFQLWQTDWDNWVKPQEDLTLTPTSGDPDLSPTPSTFMFPPVSSTSCQGEAWETPDSKQESNKTVVSVWPASAATQPVVPASGSGVSTLTTPQCLTVTSSSSTHSSTCKLLSATASDPAGTQRANTFSSELFSLSSTPPKGATRTDTTMLNVGCAKSAIDFSTSEDAAKGLAPESATSVNPDVSSEAGDRLASDLPLAINTAQGLSINTSAAPAPSPSSSSLSSLQMSTPPMMLSPAAGSAEPPPQTPSVGRANSVLSSIINQAGTDSLVKDLFPGPAGDAPVLDTNRSSEHPKEITASSGLLSRIKDEEATTQSLSSPGPSHTESSVAEKAIEGSTNFLLKTDAIALNVLDRQSSQNHSEPSQGEERKKIPVFETKNIKDKDSCADVECVDSFTSATMKASESSEAGHSQLNQAPEAPESSGHQNNQGVNDGSAPGSPSSPGSHHQHPWNADIKLQNGNLSPNHVSSPLPGVNGIAESERGPSFCNEDDEDTQDNDTDTAEESADPYKNCEHNLLVHVQQVHTDIEQQLDGLEARMLELENSEHNNPTIQLSEENILNDVPALKKSLSKLARYLMKVQHFTS